MSCQITTMLSSELDVGKLCYEIDVKGKLNRMFFDKKIFSVRFIQELENDADEFRTEFAIESESNFKGFWERNIQRIQTRKHFAT